MSQGRASQGDCARRGRRLLVTAQDQAGGDYGEGCGPVVAPATVGIWLGVGR